MVASFELANLPGSLATQHCFGRSSRLGPRLPWNRSGVPYMVGLDQGGSGMALLELLSCLGRIDHVRPRGVALVQPNCRKA